MRKLLALAVAGALLVPAAAFADIEFSSIKPVAVTIAPTIKVSTDPGTTAVTPTLQTGDIKLQVPFRIDANTQWVNIQAFATDLYKADAGVVGSQSAHKILHSGKVDVTVLPSPDPEALGALVGATGPAQLTYDGNKQSIAPDSTAATVLWEFYQTNLGRYESGIRGRFSHDIKLGVTWNNGNSELPQGNYSGFVRLYGQVVI